MTEDGVPVHQELKEIIATAQWLYSGNGNGHKKARTFSLVFWPLTISAILSNIRFKPNFYSIIDFYFHIYIKYVLV